MSLTPNLFCKQGDQSWYYFVQKQIQEEKEKLTFPAFLSNWDWTSLSNAGQDSNSNLCHEDTIAKIGCSWSISATRYESYQKGVKCSRSERDEPYTTDNSSHYLHQIRKQGQK